MIKSATPHQNSHIECIKSQLKDLDSNQLDYLVIAHSDPQLHDQIASAFNNTAIGLVNLPQSLWDMEKDFTQLVEWAVQNLKIRNLVLIGHSSGGYPGDVIEVCPTGPAERQSEMKPRLGNLTNRFENARACTQSTENHFLNQLSLLGNVPAVQMREADEKGFLQGLFYRAECGVFCAYDREQESFRALVAS